MKYTRFYARPQLPGKGAEETVHTVPLKHSSKSKLIPGCERYRSALLPSYKVPYKLLQHLHHYRIPRLHILLPTILEKNINFDPECTRSSSALTFHKNETCTSSFGSPFKFSRAFSNCFFNSIEIYSTSLSFNPLVIRS